MKKYSDFTTQRINKLKASIDEDIRLAAWWEKEAARMTDDEDGRKFRRQYMANLFLDAALEAEKELNAIS